MERKTFAFTLFFLISLAFSVSVSFTSSSNCQGYLLLKAYYDTNSHAALPDSTDTGLDYAICISGDGIEGIEYVDISKENLKTGAAYMPVVGLYYDSNSHVVIDQNLLTDIQRLQDEEVNYVVYLKVNKPFKIGVKSNGCGKGTCLFRTYDLVNSHIASCESSDNDASLYICIEEGEYTKESCETFGGTWTGSACCINDASYLDSDHPEFLCISGQVYECNQDSLREQEKIGELTYTCVYSERDGLYYWEPESDPDKSEAVCEAMRKVWISNGTSSACCGNNGGETWCLIGANKVCYHGEAVSGNEFLCINGKLEVCNQTNLCKNESNYFCMQENGNYTWVQVNCGKDCMPCTSSGFCKPTEDGYEWNFFACESLSGIYNYGNAPGFDDPTAENRSYACVSNLCKYEIVATKDCDELDGNYSVEGFDYFSTCGNDPVEERDYYVRKDFECVYEAKRLEKTSCDAFDSCSGVCVNETYLAGAVDSFPKFDENGKWLGECEKIEIEAIACEGWWETDDGKNYFVTGNVSIVNGCENGACVEISKQDYCEGNVLHEFYIENGSLKEEKIDCSLLSNSSFKFECKNGACIAVNIDGDESEQDCNLAGGVWLKSSCCGDDEKEYYSYRKGDIEDESDAACCKSAGECVFNGKCWEEETEVQLKGKKYKCLAGYWFEVTNESEGLKCETEKCKELAAERFGECYTGYCTSKGCEFKPKECGAKCSKGVCFNGTCIEPRKGGETCYCNEMCESGLICFNNTCVPLKGCGNGICEPGECGVCEDCKLSDCIGDGICSVSIGENCSNSPDCKCNILVDAAPVIIEGDYGELPVVVKNRGNSPGSVKILVKIGDKVEEKVVDLEPNEEKTLRIRLEGLASGEHEAEVLAVIGNYTAGNSTALVIVEKPGFKFSTAWLYFIAFLAAAAGIAYTFFLYKKPTPYHAPYAYVPRYYYWQRRR